MFYKKVVRPLLFKLSPEQAHEVTMSLLNVVGIPQIIKFLYHIAKPSPKLSVKLGNLHFKHPLGLAAGLDKNAKAVSAFSALGFGFMEVGTVTPLAQPGNPGPRLFRLLEDCALINRMGFNNEGIQKMKERLTANKKAGTIPIGINIGKNKITPNESAYRDYQQCIRTLHENADFFIINVSSPNTPGLRSLQFGEELSVLLKSAKAELKDNHCEKPLFLKVAPDMQEDEIESIVKTALENEITGIVATNTTLSRAGLRSDLKNEQGGLSGKPLKAVSTDIIRKIYKLSQGKLFIIGSGGVFDAQDAYEKIKAGASLVEVYTSFIYEGPSLMKRMHQELLQLMEKDGYSHISQAIGLEHR